MAATYYRLPEAARQLAAIPGPGTEARYCPGAEVRRRGSADGSEAKSPVGELWGVRSRREDAATLGQDAHPLVFHSQDLPGRKGVQSDESDDRVDLEVVLDPGDRGSLGQIAHESNTKFQRVLMPQDFFLSILGYGLV